MESFNFIYGTYIQHNLSVKFKIMLLVSIFSLQKKMCLTSIFKRLFINITIKLSLRRINILERDITL